MRVIKTIAALIAGFSVFALAAPATANDTPTLTVSSDTVTPGQSINVTISGFVETMTGPDGQVEPGLRASAHLDPVLPVGVLPNGEQEVYPGNEYHPLGDVQIPTSGTLTFTVVIPDWVEPGNHAIAVIQGDTAAYATVTVRTVGETSPETTSDAAAPSTTEAAPETSGHAETASGHAETSSGATLRTAGLWIAGLMVLQLVLAGAVIWAIYRSKNE